METPKILRNKTIEIKNNSKEFISLPLLNRKNHNLMLEICKRKNIEMACEKIIRNKGAPGIDGMSVQNLHKYIQKNLKKIKNSLISGEYLPKPIRIVDIPKKTGGIRRLGIPSTLDRVVQQSILQVLQSIYDPTFSNSSFGYRRHRNVHQAVLQANSYLIQGYYYTISIDLINFFDNVNHDLLMSFIAKRIDDKILLKLLRRFLMTPIAIDGKLNKNRIGILQGAPLSPLFSNIYLNELDNELESRGHVFCRYADDLNIFVKSKCSGRRVFYSIQDFLKSKLKLLINEQKSNVVLTKEKSFFGFQLSNEGQLSISEKDREKIEELFLSFFEHVAKSLPEKKITRLKLNLLGLINYFTHLVKEDFLNEIRCTLLD
ncbi:TPA: group II intron reverse transcriptase/maturase [Legionella anisa]